MQMGSPEFVLAIIGMAMFAGVMKAAVRAKHGYSDPQLGGKKGRNVEIVRLRDENAGLRDENTRLSARLETYEDRLIVLERIVTDKGYGVAAEIEALRDQRSVEERLGARERENGR